MPPASPVLALQATPICCLCRDCADASPQREGLDGVGCDSLPPRRRAGPGVNARPARRCGPPDGHGDVSHPCRTDFSSMGFFVVAIHTRLIRQAAVAARMPHIPECPPREPVSSLPKSFPLPHPASLRATGQNRFGPVHAHDLFATSGHRSTRFRSPRQPSPPGGRAAPYGRAESLPSPAPAGRPGFAPIPRLPSPGPVPAPRRRPIS